ncbi:MAG TPA: 30S ribosomal protein S8 [bacterium]|nr:30S ribosomal protein S8 [bacterium]
MSMTDPIADLLTRIRNGVMARHEAVDIPASKIKLAIAGILKEEGYIRNVTLVKDRKQGILHIELKYDGGTESVIRGIKRASTPGRRFYAGYHDLPKVLHGLGIAILSTPRGILTDHACRKLRVGGEVLCYVW